MTAASRPDPLPLVNSWPLFDAALWMKLRYVLGLCSDETVSAAEADKANALIAGPDMGIWACDLADNSLTWTGPVYDLFGLPRNERLTRGFAASCYGTHSRSAMEQLRAHAIRHRRGFTLDGQIRRPNGDVRWMRLSAIPVLEGGRAVRLCGTKQDVTAEYDGPGWRGF